MQGRYTMTLPDYTVGVEAYEKIREICPRYGKTAVVIGGRHGVEAAQAKLVDAAEGVGMEFTGFLLAGREATYKNVARLCHDPAVMDADMIFAVGGGKAIDQAKEAAHQLNKPYFTFPTVAGSSAAISGIATMYEEDGRFADYGTGRVKPVASFLCSRIMAKAPVEFLLRGISDTMAKYYESQIAARGKHLRHTDAVGLALSHLCADPLYTYGLRAVEANKRGIVDEAFEQVMLSVIVSSGMVSNFAAPEYNGHIAHTLYEEFAKLPVTKKKHTSTHGGLTAYGTLLLLLADKQKDEFKRLYQFYQSVGLPVCKSEIGVTEQQVQNVFTATEAHQNVRIMPYKITLSMLNQAADELERYHRQHPC